MKESPQNRIIKNTAATNQSLIVPFVFFPHEHSPIRHSSVQQKLLEAHEEQNSEAFTEAVKEFDSVSRLDQWLTTMLLRIKKTIQGDAGDLK